jgi:hypothetical protein
MTEAGALLAKGRGVSKALRRIGEESGQPPRMDSKEARIRLQKLVYLLKVGGYPPAQKFEFNMYVNGPYSPDLAEVYYAFENPGLATAEPAKDIPDRLVADIAAADANGVDFLEALATAIDLAKSGQRQGMGTSPLGKGLEWAKSIKPHIDRQTWTGVREFLRTHPGLAGST